MIGVWEAYGMIDRDRPPCGMGGGFTSIPFSSICAYADRFGIDDVAEFERFARLIIAMDNAFLKFNAEQAKKNGDNARSR